MNFKKFISGVSALTIAASAFAGMAVTANAEDKNANLSPTADTYLSWGNSETSYGTSENLYMGIWQEMWTNATPGIKANSATTSNIALLKFDVSAYKGQITGATFKATITNPSTNSNTRSAYLGYCTVENWDETTTAKNSGVNTRSATDLNIQPFNISQSVAKGNTKECSFSNDALINYLNNDADGIVTLIVYTLGQEMYMNSKEAASGKPVLTLTYTEETTYDYTINYVCGENIVKTESGKSVAGEVSAKITSTTERFAGTAEGYTNKNYFVAEGATTSFTVTSTGTNVFTVAAREAANYTGTVNAYAEINGVKTQIGSFSENFVEGDTKYVYYDKYIKYDNKYYVTSDTSYGKSFTETGTQNVETYSEADVDYAIEGEDIAGTDYVTNGAKSGGQAGRIRTAPVNLTWSPDVESTVKLTVNAYESSGNSGSDFTLPIYIVDAEGVATDSGESMEWKKSANGDREVTVTVPANGKIQLYYTGTYRSNLYVDYVTIEVTAAASDEYYTTPAQVYSNTENDGTYAQAYVFTVTPAKTVAGDFISTSATVTVDGASAVGENTISNIGGPAVVGVIITSANAALLEKTADNVHVSLN